MTDTRGTTDYCLLYDDKTETFVSNGKKNYKAKLEEMIEQITRFNKDKVEIINRLNSTVFSNDKLLSEQHNKIYAKIADINLDANLWAEITLQLSDGSISTHRETNLNIAILGGQENLEKYIARRVGNTILAVAHNFKEDECQAIICGYLWDLSEMEVHKCA